MFYKFTVICHKEVNHHNNIYHLEHYMAQYRVQDIFL